MFEYFQKCSEIVVLYEAKKMDVFGVWVKGELLVDDEKQKNCTIYLLSNEYSSNNVLT